MSENNFNPQKPLGVPEQEDIYEGAPIKGEETCVDWENNPQQAVQYKQPAYRQAPPQPPLPQNGPYPPGVQPWGPPPAQNGPPPQWNGPYAGYPQGPVPPKPKQKMDLGLKIFLFVFSFLIVGTVGGLLVYAGFAGISGGLRASDRVENWLPPEFEEGFEERYGFEDDSPESDVPPHMRPDATPMPAEGVEPEIVQPDIDVPKDAKGLNILDKPTGAELSPQEVYDKVLISTVTVKAKIPLADGSAADSVGTGIIITADGFMITNSHVVGNTKSSGITIITSSGTEYPAVVVGFDKATDLAVLKTEDGGFTPAEIGNSDELAIGEWVMAIGNPGGSAFSGSLTRGVVSGLDRAVGYANEETMTYIQTDAAINPGNSGGPLVNMYGQVVGINSSKIIADYYEGMGFAIPATKAKDIVDALLSEGYVSGRVRLGIVGSDITQQAAMLNGVPTGVLIREINSDSSFAGTNAAPGDIITAVDGDGIGSLAALSAKFLEYKPGETAEVTLYRPGDSGAQGSEFKVTVTLLEDKGETQR